MEVQSVRARDFLQMKQLINTRGTEGENLCLE